MGSKIGNTLEQITDYLVIANEKLLQQYKGKDNFQKVLTIFSDQLNNVEQVMFDIYLKRWISTAEGKQLDNIGYNLSFERNGLNDDNYRQVLYGKIGQYNSNGTINEIIRIIRLMTNAEFVLVSELFPAKLNIAIIGDSLNLNKDLLKASIKGSIAGGVGIDLIISGNIPVFVYKPEDGSDLLPQFSGYPAEDSSTVSYYAETI